MQANLVKKVDLKVLVLISLVVLSCSFVEAQQVLEKEQYKFMHLNINDGLSNNQVRAILKDSQGFLWFGTSRGLNRYDGMNIKHYKHSPYDETSIPFNMIDFLFEDYTGKIWIKSLSEFVVFDPKIEAFIDPVASLDAMKIPVESLWSLFRDQDGGTWFVTRQHGLFKFNPKDSSVVVVQYDSEDSSSISFNEMDGMAQDSRGHYWSISSSGVLEHLTPEDYRVTQRFELNQAFSNESNNYCLFVDSDDDVWVYSPGQPYGVFIVDTSTGEVREGRADSHQVRLNNNLVSSIVQDNNGLVWLATDHGGINLVDKSDWSVRYLLNNPDDDYSICQNSINFLYRDSEDIVWAGTYKKGISYYHEDLIRFKHYRHVPSLDSSLPFNDVNCFVEDKKGNLWIGTNGGGLLYFDRVNNQYKVFKHDPNKLNSLSNNVIVALFIDRSSQLWIGTYYGGLNRYDGQTFHHYKHDPNDPTSLSDNRVWEIFEDSRRNLWIGTLTGGLELFDREKGVFLHYDMEDMNSVGSNFIMSIMEDSENTLWLGTADGLDCLNLQTKRFEHFEADPGATGMLSDRNVLAVHEDARGFLWIATPEGLNLYSKTEKKFRVFTEDDGLADSNIKTILEDQQGNLWVGTTSGLSKVEIRNFQATISLEQLEVQVSNFDMMDGLQGKEFNENAAYRTKSGELIFGGANGFNLFIPEDLGTHKLNNRIVLTDFKVFNQEVLVGIPFRNRVILNQAITQQEKINLRYNENIFSLSFAALNFFQPEKNRFEYKLEGFNDEWLKAEVKKSEATFTNLNAGEYAFRVRVSNDQGNSWNEMQPPLVIEISPPFWQTYYAMAIYALIIGGGLLLARRMLVERERLRFRAEQEHQEAERMQQLDALKTRFFTNISHEFRTPLSLILAPLEKIIAQTNDAQQQEQLRFIHRHARRLLAMVNQLLDFRKLEVQKIAANKSWGDIVGFVKDIGFSFQGLADNKGVSFRFEASPQELYTLFDKDKIEKIISNLLSNAYKFTPGSGEIMLRMNLNAESGKERTGGLQIVVQDNGIGVSEEKQKRIFDRFFQDDLPSSLVNPGSGIGLSLVSEYIAILDGQIRVESQEGVGSSFIIELPVDVFSAEEITDKNRTHTKQQTIYYEGKSRDQLDRKPDYDSSKATILLVEDSEDFRFYLKDNLKDYYNILEAEHGRKAWELALKRLPDLVVSDVMMPEMDGLELCAKIKRNGKTAHIPVILLTARVETGPIVEGYESGADDYISKPFNFQILESRIENLINSRKQLRISFQALLGLNPSKASVSSFEENFLNKVLAVVEENLAQSEFSVEDLSRELGMSRVSLYKKLVQLTSKSPLELIRIIRLRRAADLMENSQMTVSEIAYQCGFNSPRYFSKHFRQMYQQLPSNYIEKHRKRQDVKGFSF